MSPPPPPDIADPTISIVSPAWGAWTVQGSAGLLADYSCADETELTVCLGDVADGAAVADSSLGAATLSVHAEDAAGHAVDASASYLVFGSVSGSVLDGEVGPSPWLTLSLGMGLGHTNAHSLGAAFLSEVDCATGAVTFGLDRRRRADEGGIGRLARGPLADRPRVGRVSLARAGVQPAGVGRARGRLRPGRLRNGPDAEAAPLAGAAVLAPFDPLEFHDDASAASSAPSKVRSWPGKTRRTEDASSRRRVSEPTIASASSQSSRASA